MRTNLIAKLEELLQLKSPTVPQINIGRFYTRGRIIRPDG